MQRCLIYPRYNALLSLEQFSLVPQERRDLDISPRLQSRDTSLNYLPNTPNSIINGYFVHAWQPGFTSQVQRRPSGAHGESSVNPECVRTPAHTEPACLARLAHPACQSHHTCPALCIWVLSCWATEVHLRGHHLYIQLRVAVGQPFGDSTNLPVNPNIFLIQQLCSQNDHGAVESSRCHCRKWSDFPMKKNRDGVFVKGNVKFLHSFSQFHETPWVHAEYFSSVLPRIWNLWKCYITLNLSWKWQGNKHNEDSLVINKLSQICWSIYRNQCYAGGVSWKRCTFINPAQPSA